MPHLVEVLVWLSGGLIAVGVICGFGADSYRLALSAALIRLGDG
jgi:3-dehydroquinate dehydratase